MGDEGAEQGGGNFRGRGGAGSIISLTIVVLATNQIFYL